MISLGYPIHMQYLFFSLLAYLFAKLLLIFNSQDNKTFKTLLQVKPSLKCNYNSNLVQTQKAELHSTVIKKISKAFICFKQVSYSRYTENKFYIHKEKYIYQPDESSYIRSDLINYALSFQTETC